MFHFFPIQEAECIYWQGLAGLCTKNTSWALIERPYSCAPQAVGAVYDRPGFFVQSPENGRDRIELLKHTPDIDAILVDVMMPDIDSYETMREIRKKPVRRITYPSRRTSTGCYRC